MFRTVCMALMITAVCAPVHAQARSSRNWQRHTTVFVSNGRGGSGRTILHFGVGLEWLRGNGLGITGEVGPRFRDHAISALDDVMVSIAATYHFGLPQSRRLTPFLVGGFAYAFEPVPDPGPAFFFVDTGGGILYRLSDSGGLRLEFRNAEPVGQEPTTPRHWGIRVGYTWMSP